MSHRGDFYGRHRTEFYRSVCQTLQSQHDDFSFVLIAAALAGFAFHTFKPLSRYFSKTQFLTPSQIIHFTSADLPLYNVAVTGLEMTDTGYTEERTENGVVVSTEAYFGVLFLEDENGISKGLMIRSGTPIDETLLTYGGFLTEPTYLNKDMYNSLRDDILEANSSLDDLLLFQVFDADPEHQAMFWFGYLVIEIVALLGGLVIFGIATMRKDPHKHPIVSNLSRYGDAESLIDQVERDMARGKTQQVDKLQLTPNWIVYQSGNEIEFARLKDIVWAYKLTTWTNGISSYTAVISDRTGHQIIIGGKEKDVDAMIAAVIERVPWAIAGHNDKIASVWKTDREKFIRAVDKRHSEMKVSQSQ